MLPNVFESFDENEYQKLNSKNFYDLLKKCTNFNDSQTWRIDSFYVVS
jgi:hypothetical protein